jgi:hypothetical protein
LRLTEIPLRVVNEGKEIEWEQLGELLVEPSFRVLSRRWLVERTFSWIEARTER